MTNNKVLVYGYNGWIGTMFVNEFEKRNWTVFNGKSRVDDTILVEKELIDTNPDRVVCCIGRTHGEGIPTIDYLEQKGKLRENINDNLFAPVSLAILCNKLDIHLSYLGTGCIFDGPPADKIYTEEDKPDFFGSSYSTVKGYTDRLMHLIPDVLNMRIRMPIVSYSNPRNFITKITNYDKICSIHNSMTVLDEMIPIMVDLSVNKQKGTFNMTNPGVISHNEILEMYKKYVDPEFTWKNFSIEEQDTVLASKRSNNHLDTKKLTMVTTNGSKINDIHTAVEKCLINYKKYY